MTDAEWKECSDPTAMLRAVKGQVDDRVLHLFAVSSCRLVWPLLSDPRSRQAVELAEHYARGSATSKQLAKAATEAKQAFDAIIANEDHDYDTDETFRRQCDAAQAVMDVARPSAWTAAWNTAMLLDWERGRMAGLLRELLGSH
jgi:hypothetical protein